MNRSYIGQQIFHDEEKRLALNGIIHPIVREIMEEEKQSALAAGKPVIMDIPLLYENKLEETVDAVWVVYVTKEVQLERLMKRNDLTRKRHLHALRLSCPLKIRRKEQMSSSIIMARS